MNLEDIEKYLIEIIKHTSETKQHLKNLNGKVATNTKILHTDCPAKHKAVDDKIKECEDELDTKITSISKLVTNLRLWKAKMIGGIVVLNGVVTFILVKFVG
jgi:hypothetical protein